MLLFFDLGSGEILLILLVLFIVVGPRQLPEVARTVGKAINEMKRASASFRNEIQKEATRLERETALNEIQKTVLDLDLAQSPKNSDALTQAQHQVTTDDSLPDAIPFGSDQSTLAAQNEIDTNKS